MMVKEQSRIANTPLPVRDVTYKFHDCEVQVVDISFDTKLKVVFIFYRYTNHCYAPGEAHRMTAADFHSMFAGEFQTPENVLEFAA